MAALEQAPSRGLDVRLPPHAYFVGSAVFHYLGPAFAVLLFARVDVLGVAWLRIAAAAAVLGLWRRPSRAVRGLDCDAKLLLVALGLTFALMNACFYVAIDRLPLATVAAIEFIGPITLACVGVRIARNVVAVVAAASGVYLLTRVESLGGTAALGFAFANAALFAAYIVLAHRLSRLRVLSPVDGLAAAMLCALVFVTPIGGWTVLPALADPVAIAAGIGVGVSSSVVPYVLDQLAMARLSRSTYALFVALLPATATIVGALVLRQIPFAAELAGIALVMLGVAIHRPDDAKPRDRRSRSRRVRTRSSRSS